MKIVNICFSRLIAFFFKKSEQPLKSRGWHEKVEDKDEKSRGWHEKEEDKDEKHTGKLTRRIPNIKVVS